MNLLELSALMQDEKKCEEYLRQVGILKDHTNCLKCNSTKIGRVRRHRWKCYDCNYEWHIRRGSILKLTKLEFSVFISLLKLFSDESTLNKCAKDTKVSKQVVSFIFWIFRLCLSEIDIQTFKILNRKSTTSGKEPSLGVIEDGAFIKVVLQEEVNADKSNNKVLIHAKRIRNESHQICYQYFLKHPIDLIKGQYSYDSIDRFWSYAHPKLNDQKISKELNFFVFMKELEIRYNSNASNIFEIIISKITKNTWVADCLPEVGV